MTDHPANQNPEESEGAPGEYELVAGANRAVHDAIAELHRSGIATTHFIDGKLVRVHPDGRREDLGPLPAA